MSELSESAATTPGEDSGPNIQRYLHIFLKRKWLVLSTLVIVLGSVAVWTYTRTKIYKASATVLVEQRAPQVLGSQVNEVVDISMGGVWRNKEYMETQVKVITSASLARRVAERLHLAADHKFWSAKVHGTPTVDQAAERLRGLVKAPPPKESNIIEISVEHPDRELATRLANAVTQSYIDQNIEYKLSSTSGAVKWLSDQLDDLKKQLESAELALYQFKKNHNIISLSLEDKQSILARQIEKVTDALTDVRVRRMAIDSQRKQVLLAIADNKDKDPLKLAATPVLENTIIQKLKDVLIDEQRKLSALREKYLDRHPVALEQKAKVQAARRDLEREVKNVLSALESRHREIRDNEGKIAAALQQAKDEALDLNKREVSYQRLKRSQENTAKLYTLVLSRMKESDLSAQLRVNNIRSLDPAVEPHAPVYPKVQLNLLIGLLLGLMLGIGLAFLVDTLDSSIKSQEDVDLVPDLVFLGLMPKIPGSLPQRNGRRPEPRPELDLLVHRDPKSIVAEACRSIRTNILFASTDRTMKCIAVTSPGPKEGKTTTAVNLSIVMAQAGVRVLLVDTDMRRPRLHRIFGVPGTDGITTVLLGGADVRDLVQVTEVPGLHVLPCGPIPPNPAELCQADRFKSLLAELREQYDLVVLDSPPVMVVTDAVVLSTLVDATLVVARTGRTARNGLRDTVRQVREVGGHIVGCVLNDMDLEKGGYGYYRYRRYGYYRYRAYSRDGYGYGNYGEKEETAN